MENVIKYLNESNETAAVYAFIADEPTMTNSRLESIGTGSHTSYVKIATGFQNAFVFFARSIAIFRPKRIPSYISSLPTTTL